jgi:4-hydroxy-tetrahydrodipicolinate synthase
VIAGAGSNDTVRAIELTRLAEAAGADAVVSVVPYYNKSMQAGIEAHFRAVADATALPVILHDTTPSLRMTDGLLRVLVCPHLVTSLNG